MNSLILVSQNLTQRQESINELTELQGLKKDHPDLLCFESDQKLGVAEAKKIREFLSLKPYSSKGRAAVLESAHKLTIEAQNSLLKTLEEPPSNSLIILGVERQTQLLPTILSRCQIINLLSSSSHMSTHSTSLSVDLFESEPEGSPQSRRPEFIEGSSGNVFDQEIERLIDSSIDQRFEYIEKLEEKEKFIKALTAYYRNELALHPGSVNLEFARSVMEAEKWAGENVNLRFVLEHLMLIMPSKK